MSKGLSGLFSGTIGWLAHHGGRIIPGKDGIVTGGDSQKLGGNILKTMGMPKSGLRKGYQAQHIIPAELKTHPVIQKIGMDMDNATNGILLPTPNQKSSTLPRHRGYHSIYSSFVRGQLNKLDINKSSLELQREVAQLQGKLRKLQESGLPLYKGFSDKDGKAKIYPKRKGNTIEMWERRFKNL